MGRTASRARSLPAGDRRRLSLVRRLQLTSRRANGLIDGAAKFILLRSVTNDRHRNGHVDDGTSTSGLARPANADYLARRKRDHAEHVVVGAIATRHGELATACHALRAEAD